MTGKEILQQIRNNKDRLQKLGIIKIGLFGSYSRGDHSETSDVDLILEFNTDQKNFHNYMKVCDILEEIIPKKIDVVTPESLSPYIQPYIEKEAIYEKF